MTLTPSICDDCICSFTWYFIANKLWVLEKIKKQILLWQYNAILDKSRADPPLHARRTALMSATAVTSMHLEGSVSKASPRVTFGCPVCLLGSGASRATKQ